MSYLMPAQFAIATHQTGKSSSTLIHKTACDHVTYTGTFFHMSWTAKKLKWKRSVGIWWQMADAYKVIVHSFDSSSFCNLGFSNLGHTGVIRSLSHPIKCGMFLFLPPNLTTFVCWWRVSFFFLEKLVVIIKTFKFPFLQYIVINHECIRSK